MTSPPSRAPGFRLFIIGALVSNIGTWMQIVAVGWLVAELTKDPIWAGVIAFSGGVPILTLTLIGGVIADHFDRRKFLLLTQVLLLVFAACLAVLTHLHLVHLWHVALLSCLAGTATALNNPVYSGFLFDIVGKDHVARAVSINSTQLHISRTVGPLIAGVSIGTLGTAGCFALNAISFLAVIPLIAWIPLSENQNPAPIALREIRKKLGESFVYVQTHSFLLTTLAVLAVTSLAINPHLNLLPLYLKNSLGFGAKFLGLVWALSGAGSIFTAVSYGRFFHARSSAFHFRACTSGALLCGLGLIVLASSRNPIVLAASVFLMGLAFTLVTLSCQVLLQVSAPASLRGRLLAIWNLCFQGMFPIGNLIFAALAQHTSIPFAWRIGGIALFAVVSALLWGVFRGSAKTNKLS